LLLGGFGTVQDVTERKVLQDKLEDYTRHLERLVEERTRELKDAERLATIGETAGMVSHDIRNPLQSISGELYLAKEELDSLSDSDVKKNLNESVGMIEEQLVYINKIVSDLQDYAKPLFPQIESVDLHELLRDILPQLSVPETIQVIVEVEKSFPKLMVDPSFMKRVFSNLFLNAAQAMPNGGKLIVKGFCKNRTAYISVEDTGVGIPEEVKPKIFRPLFTTKAKGQGFGLAICKRMIEVHNGKITFESQTGKGTKFLIEIPLKS